MRYRKKINMPPIKKYDRESIINIALEIAKNEGFDKINARRIARELNSSVNPIFNNFKNMDELKKEVYIRIYELYKEYMLRDINEEKAYKKMGLNYIRYAKDYPLFFKLIFMQSTNLNAADFIMADEIGDNVIKKGQLLTGLNYEEQKKFHIKVWIFTHGIASLVASGTIKFSDEEIAGLLENTVREMLEGYLTRKEK